MAEIAALIISIATLVTAIGAIAVGIMNAQRIADVHVSINSRMDQLLKSHGLEMKAEGVAEERASNRGPDSSYPQTSTGDPTAT
jgi:hypothetical protein